MRTAKIIIRVYNDTGNLGYLEVSPEMLEAFRPLAPELAAKWRIPAEEAAGVLVLNRNPYAPSDRLDCFVVVETDPKTLLERQINRTVAGDLKNLANLVGQTQVLLGDFRLPFIQDDACRAVRIFGQTSHPLPLEQRAAKKGFAIVSEASPPATDAPSPTAEVYAPTPKTEPDVEQGWSSTLKRFDRKNAEGPNPDYADAAIGRFCAVYDPPTIKPKRPIDPVALRLGKALGCHIGPFGGHAKLKAG